MSSAEECGSDRAVAAPSLDRDFLGDHRRAVRGSGNLLAVLGVYRIYDDRVLLDVDDHGIVVLGVNDYRVACGLDLKGRASRHHRTIFSWKQVQRGYDSESQPDQKHQPGF